MDIEYDKSLDKVSPVVVWHHTTQEKNIAAKQGVPHGQIGPTMELTGNIIASLVENNTPLQGFTKIGKFFVGS